MATAKRPAAKKAAAKRPAAKKSAAKKAPAKKVAAKKAPAKKAPANPNEAIEKTAEAFFGADRLPRSSRGMEVSS